MANKGKQTPTLVPVVTTARGESTTVLPLSSQQKDSGSLMQKAFLFAFCSPPPPPFQKKQEQRIQFCKGCHLSYGLAQISGEISGNSVTLLSRWFCSPLYLERKLPGTNIILNRPLYPARFQQSQFLITRLKDIKFLPVFLWFFTHSVHTEVHLR